MLKAPGLLSACRILAWPEPTSWVAGQVPHPTGDSNHPLWSSPNPWQGVCWVGGGRKNQVSQMQPIVCCGWDREGIFEDSQRK